MDKTVQEHARKVAKCCHIACDVVAAKDIDKTICGLLDALDAAESEIAALQGRFDDEYKIVDRVWKALGVTTYEGADGKTVWELVAENKSRLSACVTALELILPLAKGYAPEGQTKQARKVCREWIAVAEDALAAVEKTDAE